ncbi:MAG: hypothetical protein V2A58_12910 [Planctomycetota bacterium]
MTELRKAGVRSVAVCRAVISRSDPAKAAAELRELLS